MHTYIASDHYSDASGNPLVTDTATLIADAIPSAIANHQSFIGDPIVISTPTHVADVRGLDFSSGSREIDYVRAINGGSSITMIAYYVGGGSISASTNVPDVTSNVPFALNFDFGVAGGMKLVINPVISTSDNPNASELIAQGIAYANQLSGTPGWLTYDTGSGLSFNIWGTDSNASSLAFSAPSAFDQINGNTSTLISNPYTSLQSSSISLAKSSHAGGNIGITSIAQNGGITLQGDGQTTTAFILKGTNSDYVLVDDPRNIVYDGNAVFWQGPASHVDPNYVNDTARGEYLDANTWIGQPGVVLNQNGGQLIHINTAYTGQLQSNGTVSLNYVHGSPMNNVVIARDAKGTLDGDFFSSVSNEITNVNGSGINLSLIQSISPYDSAVDANVIITSPIDYSNTPNVSSPASASISRSAVAQDTEATINGVGYAWNDLGSTTVDGIIYSFNGTPTLGHPIEATVKVINPSATTTSVSVENSLGIDALLNKQNLISASSLSGGAVITAVAANSASNYILDGAITKYTTARDAQLSIDGINLVRSSNTISDYVTGVTFQIMANPLPGTTKTADVKIELGADNTEKMITDLANAYNKLIKDYNSMTGNASNGRAGNGKAGTFGSNPTTLSFVETVKRKFATGATYNIGTNDANGGPYILSLASLGLDYQLDGTLKYNSIEYLTSQANGLREKFFKGLRIGYVSVTDNLMSFIKSQSGPSGALAQEMTIENNSINTLNKEQDNLQTRLNKIQDNYIAQYSGLNALLFQLNSTSTNLGNALTALNNMSASK
jgi:flagellar hook-associated protein 2